MFENLSERLESAFKQIKGEGRITELNIAATVKDIRRALIDADVNFKIAKEFTDTVREKALGQKVLTAVSPGQLMIKVVKDELVELMGGTETELNAKGSPAVILIAGLQGSGAGQLPEDAKGVVAFAGCGGYLSPRGYRTTENIG
jgi:signal recognition particle subunit SRP54